MFPARNWSEVQETSATKFCTTYIESTVALQNAGVDLDICTIDINRSALEVACPPRGIGAEI
jgi:hypothetical protein